MVNIIKFIKYLGFIFENHIDDDPINSIVLKDITLDFTQFIEDEI